MPIVPLLSLPLIATPLQLQTRGLWLPSSFELKD